MKVHIVVWYRGADKPAYYEVDRKQGWRFDALGRQLIVGQGLGRIHIPLDNVLAYSPEEITDAQ